MDAEPNRSVQIRRRIDTRIPNPLLSTITAPVVSKPSLGGLTNLKSKAVTNGSRGWGVGSGTGTSTATAGGGGGGGAWGSSSAST